MKFIATHLAEFKIQNSTLKTGSSTSHQSSVFSHQPSSAGLALQPCGTSTTTLGPSTTTRLGRRGLAICGLRLPLKLARKSSSLRGTKNLRHRKDRGAGVRALRYVARRDPNSRLLCPIAHSCNRQSTIENRQSLMP